MPRVKKITKFSPGKSSNQVEINCRWFPRVIIYPSKREEIKTVSTSKSSPLFRGPKLSARRSKGGRGWGYNPVNGALKMGNDPFIILYRSGRIWSRFWLFGKKAEPALPGLLCVHIILGSFSCLFVVLAKVGKFGGQSLFSLVDVGSNS